MVSKIIIITPKTSPKKKSPKIPRRRRIKNPSPSSAGPTSLRRSLRTCRRHLLNLFTLLSPTNLKSHRLRRFHKLPHPPTLPSNPSKPTLFLDLDETLIHSKPQIPPENSVYDFVVYPKIDEKVVPFYVKKRPNVDVFLKKAAESFEVIVFTAGVEEYAKKVVDGLDPEGTLVSYRLYRDSCREMEGRLVKDLSGKGRDLGRVLIVDDNPNSYALQKENAVGIAPYLGGEGEDDAELQRVMGVLERVVGFEDLREGVKMEVRTD